MPCIRADGLTNLSILVTGSTGFIGNSIVSQLCEREGIQVVAAVRKWSDFLPECVQQSIVGDLAEIGDYTEALHGMDVVIHAAARVHVMDDASSNPLAEFRKVNVDGTLNLARQAAKAGVQRFIFLSSIGVNGNDTFKPFVESDKPFPHDPYSIGKYEAELALIKLGKEKHMEVVIIRPPLVYARHAPGNFKTLIKWVQKGVPLPLGSVHNQRSLVALDNLVSFIVLCAQHPKAANEVFLISDGEDVSTTELLQKVAKAMGKKTWLIPVPVGLMTFVVKLLGKGDVANRLFGSLQVDSSKARELLGWKPVVTMDEQLKKTVSAYLKK
ncbi:MAG: UDP-glucose 4-epimerase [Proteobacteria bacterium]|nr:MAG: UDP-glucose 4-epimerase [Pseudomonadota bacterium]